MPPPNFSWDDFTTPSSGEIERKKRVVYLLSEESSERIRPFDKIMEAKKEGQRRADAAGIAWIGWQQNTINIWWLLPDAKYKIEVRAV